MEQGELIIRGARQNNLKGIDLRLPHNRVTVITGLSGSGKSSLAFDTIFAEGQWRYIESLSAYARMFLEKVDRPLVDSIENVRPAIAIEQRNPVRTARSTVGTATELHDYLRLLFAKIGRIFCPGCDQEVKSYSPTLVADELLSSHEGARAQILFPIPLSHHLHPQGLVAILLRQGFSRLRVGGEIYELEPGLDLGLQGHDEVQVVLDRLVLRKEDRTRLVDSLEAAFQEGKGNAYVDVMGKGVLRFGERLLCYNCGQAFERPQPLFFSFNHPLGACPECKGFGNVLLYDEDLIIPDKGLSLAEGAIEPWNTPSHRWWYRQMERAVRKSRIDLHRPYNKLTEREKRLLFEGNEDFEGIDAFFAEHEARRYKLHVRVFLSRYRSPFPCPSCGGKRLKPEALNIKVGGKGIHQVCHMTGEEAATFFRTIPLSDFERGVARLILRQIDDKLDFLQQVGLGYLTLDRETRTLSGGEAQRINLANQLSARLTGTLYVLDEPTIGLHPRDTDQLAEILKDLAAAGNTVVVVEHDRTLIEAADYLVELGPGAGEEGGEVVFAGPKASFFLSMDSLTARYLRGKESIPLPPERRQGSGLFLELKGARENNLKGINVRIPLHTFTCITGVSGSGKSTLVTDTLYRALARVFKVEFSRVGQHEHLTGIEHLRGVRLIDQEPIGRTPRSNPITYIKGFDDIRKAFAALPEARRRGYGPGHFSFNVPWGRCNACEGAGYQKLEMYFFENLFVTCGECEGKRYKGEVLEITYKGKNIGEVLSMTVDETLSFFPSLPGLQSRLRVLSEVGLGYLRLGQPATTLSGGEAQRLKIAAELGTRMVRDYIYILDEPTTGLHFEDIKKLLSVLGKLVDAGNTIVVVEHNIEVIKMADYVIDLGPEGGTKGGEIVAQGPPEEIAKAEMSYTGRFLKDYFSKKGYSNNIAYGQVQESVN